MFRTFEPFDCHASEVFGSPPPLARSSFVGASLSLQSITLATFSDGGFTSHVQPEQEVPTTVCDYLMENEKLAPRPRFELATFC
jgi:hypothetical protein